MQFPRLLSEVGMVKGGVCKNSSLTAKGTSFVSLGYV